MSKLLALCLVATAGCQPSLGPPAAPDASTPGATAHYCDRAMRLADARSQRRSLAGRAAFVGAIAAAALTPWLSVEPETRLAVLALGGGLAIAGQRQMSAAEHEAAIAVAMSHCTDIDDDRVASAIARRAYRWWLDGDLDKTDLVRLIAADLARNATWSEPAPEVESQGPPSDLFHVMHRPRALE